MKPIPSFLVTTLARTDLTRISNQLYDLQRQTASGNKANDLKGFGNEAGRIVQARAAIAQSTARVDAATHLVARFEVQDAALGDTAAAAAQLKQDILTALASDNASYIAGQIAAAFQQATRALNTTHEGVSLFAGERRDSAAVPVATLADLPAAIASLGVFAESLRPQTVDLGVGAPVVVADKASAIAGQLYAVLGDLYTFTQTETLGTPITDSQRTQLVAFATAAGAAHTEVVQAQGRNGDIQARVERDIVRLTAHADLLTRHLGQIADADLAEVAMRLSAAQTQYQAAAKVFSQIKDFSLVNFLD